MPDLGATRRGIITLKDVRRRLQQISGAFNATPADEVAYRILSTDAVDGVRFDDIVFSVDAPLEVPAVVLSPLTGPPDRLAIALHQTTSPASLGKDEPAGRSGRETLHYGHQLARRGYAVICPDYPGFGAYNLDETAIYEGQGYGSVTAKGIRNHIYAVSVLRRMFAQSRGLVLSIGHSLGGSNAIFLALFDARIGAVCCSAGFSTFESYARNSQSGDLSGWARRDKYMPLIAERYASEPSRMPIDFGDMLACLSPRPLFCCIPRHDDVFPFDGAIDAVQVAVVRYKRDRHAERLKIVTPDSGHDFPDDARASAYDFVASFQPH